MLHVVLPVGLLQCNCSIFGDEKTLEAIVVDPGDDISKITAILDSHRLKVKAIVITHGHIDHIAGAHKLRSLNRRANLYERARSRADSTCSTFRPAGSACATPPKVEIDVLATDGAVLQLGGVDFEVLLTPGHTRGSLCLWIPQEKKLIAGDTLFRDSIGRTDLPGGDGVKILSSIKTTCCNCPTTCSSFPATVKARPWPRETAQPVPAADLDWFFFGLENAGDQFLGIRQAFRNHLDIHRRLAGLARALAIDAVLAHQHQGVRDAIQGDRQAARVHGPAGTRAAPVRPCGPRKRSSPILN